MSEARELEYFDVIDRDNSVVGRASRDACYALKLSHRVVHVMVEWNGAFFIPRRGLTLSHLPGYACTSAAGHVSAGETSEVAALRELREEIGLDGPVELEDEFFFTHEFPVHLSLFRKTFEPSRDRLQLSEREVLDGKFYSPKAIRRLDRARFHPQLTACLERMGLL